MTNKLFAYKKVCKYCNAPINCEMPEEGEKVIFGTCAKCRICPKCGQTLTRDTAGDFCDACGFEKVKRFYK